MSIVSINDVGQHGIVNDIPGHELPPGAWTDGRNVRFIDGYVAKCTGETQVMATPAQAPLWGMPYYNANGIPGWLYASTARAYCYENGAEYNITRSTGGDYSASPQTRWSGGVLGGVPIINNGVDAPQMWATPLGSNPLAALSNWPASTTTRVLRPFKQFLVALDVTKSGVRYPTLVKWSHPADPGSVPNSWDHTDATKDAGEYPLSETMGYCVDCLPLRDVNVIYKEDSVWGMQYIGGQYIFRFFKMFTSFGMPAKDCAVEFSSGKHLVFTGNDLIVHDGQQTTSVLDRKLRKRLADISYDNYKYCFMAPNPVMREVWFCWRDSNTAGAPTQALIWNYTTGAIGLRDLQETNFISIGRMDATVYSGPDSWDSDAATWESDTSIWGDTAFAFVHASMVGFTNNKIIRLNTEETVNGSSMLTLLKRTGISVPFKQSQLPDISSWKFCRNIWPRFTGTLGGIVTITLGQQEQTSSDIVWEPPVDFRIGIDTKLDCRLSGRMFAMKIESNSNISWQLHGYDLDVDLIGTN
jgi:hypothetical protein